MHEAGIAYQIIKQIEKTAVENNLTTVTSITLELGEASGIVEKYLLDFWRWAADKSELLKSSELRFERIQAVTICNACGKTYPTMKQGKQCPHCQSLNTVLLYGNEFNIREIEAL